MPDSPILVERDSTSSISKGLYVGAVAVLTIVAVQVAGGQVPMPGLQAPPGCWGCGC